MASAARKASALLPSPTKVFTWEGKVANDKVIRGELHANDATTARAILRRRGIHVIKIKKKTPSRKKISAKDIALFTRQLATMMKAGVPLLQAFHILAQGNDHPAVVTLMQEIRADVETGTSLHQAFRKFPLHFDPLFCNLVAAGEHAGMLDVLLERLATHLEKTLAIKKKIRSAMLYPLSILLAAGAMTAIIMIWVVPTFKEIFTSFGAALPLPTLAVIALSDFLTMHWPVILSLLIASIYLCRQGWQRSQRMRHTADRILLHLPVFGALLRKAVITRWARTFATMFTAGVPLVEALDSVGGAADNVVYLEATQQIQNEVRTGISLAAAMQNTGAFPGMVTQMVSIGEESGALDHMLAKVADFYEEDVDNFLASLSSLIEPAIMIILGVLIGGLVIAMYLPIFQLGSVI